MKKLTRDETEHGKHYYLAAEVDAALARPVQEQPAIKQGWDVDTLLDKPPKRPWVGLTDDELANLWYKESLDWMEFARAHEAALKEKNNET
jgi:hypothetical protein